MIAEYNSANPVPSVRYCVIFVLPFTIYLSLPRSISLKWWVEIYLLLVLPQFTLFHPHRYGREAPS